MAKKSSNPFESSEGHLLRWLREHQVETLSGKMAKFSQKELAAEYGLCVSTINNLIQLLVKTQCVEFIRAGRYRVTPTGNQVIQKLDEIEKIIGRDNNGD